MENPVCWNDNQGQLRDKFKRQISIPIFSVVIVQKVIIYFYFDLF